MARYLVLLLALIYLHGCTDNNPDKYELKSPCSSADIDGQDNAQSPCKRRPANIWMG